MRPGLWPQLARYQEALKDYLPAASKAINQPEKK
jgi:hypothetical protein